MPLDGTNYLKTDQLRRLWEMRDIIWTARTNMAVPGRWTRWNYGNGTELCCASHIAVAAGVSTRDINCIGIQKVLTPIGHEIFERLGGIKEIIAHNDDAKYTLEDVLKWLDGHINSLTREINALQRELL